MKIYIPCIILLSVFLSACAPLQNTDTNKDIQQKKAQEAAASITYTENAEIENIKGRLQLTANPGLLGYVTLFNDMGQPVMYTGIRGKITSGSKRLTRSQEIFCDNGVCELALAPSDEGTFGSSGDYIYFWTQSGQYIQWNGRYLYSDKPLRLTQEPLVVDVK